MTALSLKDVLKNIDNLPPAFEADGKLAGIIKVTGDSDNPEIRVTGDLTQGEINSLPLTGEFDLSYENHQVIINKILLTQVAGTLLANGVWESGRLAKLEIGLQDFPCQVINPFINPAYKLGGLANAFVLLEWSNAEVSGEYRLVVNDLQLNDYHEGDLRINGNLSDQGLAVTEGTLSRKGTFGSQRIPPLAAPIIAKVEASCAK